MNKLMDWKRSAIFTQERKTWSHLRLSRILFAARSSRCSQTQLDDIADEQTIICKQLFAGHVVDT